MTAERLPPEALRRAAEVGRFGFASTADLEPLERLVGQDRGLEALEFGVAIEAPGFNLFLLGAEGTGRRTAALASLNRAAGERPVPDDWCYVNNFDDLRRPRALRLPAGMGRQLATHMEGFTAGLAAELPRVFGSDEYRARHAAILQRVEEVRKELFERLRQEAEQRGLAVVGGAQTLSLAPRRPGGEVLTDQELSALPPEDRRRFEQARDEVQARFAEALRRFTEAAAEAQRELGELNRRTLEAAVDHLLETLRARYREIPRVLAFLAAVESDLVDLIARVTTAAQADPEALARAFAAEEFQRRYKVNVLVSRHDHEGAPVVEEPNPTFANLLGRIEHGVQQGVLTTDFMMIRAGALLRANGGYLLLDALDVLRRPLAWEALKRALRQGELRIEEPAAELGVISTVSLQPEPIPLDVKVVLLGPPVLYYLLYQLDREFGEIFKVKADFGPVVERSAEAEVEYARFIARRCQVEGIPPFDAGAVAAVVEFGSRQAGDQTRLTARLSEVADVVREAGFRARADARESVARSDVEETIAARIRRSGRLEDELHRQIEAGTLLVRTRGTAMGQVNGLSVLTLGDYSFAKPVRVSATVSLGTRGVVDLEREASLGGPVHSKGVLILTGYLNHRYGGSRPLVLSATLGFEQVYEEVEGDSASVAELLALVSAIAEIPLRQELGVTGSVDQHGQVQPVGGVSEKVEGFFHACRIQGLTGRQGVVVPARNVRHLMLRPEVVRAVEQDRFSVHAIHHVDDALALLFDRDADEVHRAVERRLDGFIDAWQRLQARAGALPPGAAPPTPRPRPDGGA